MEDRPEQEPLSPELGAINQRARLSHYIIQSIIAETDLRGTSLADEVYWQLNDLEEQNGLPEGVDAHTLYRLWETNYGGEAIS